MTYTPDSLPAKKGAIGEKIVKEHLERELGCTITKPEDAFPSGASIVDFDVHAGGERLFFAEVKVLSAFLFGPEKAPCYSIPVAKINAYIDYANKHNEELRLFIVDETAGLIFSASLAYPNSTYATLMSMATIDGRTYPLDIYVEAMGGLCRYFHQKQFDVEGKLTEEEKNLFSTLSQKKSVKAVDETVSTSPIDAKTNKTMPADNTAAIEQPSEQTSKQTQQKNSAPIPTITDSIAQVIETPNGNLHVLQDTARNWYMKVKELFHALKLNPKSSVHTSDLGKILLKYRAVAQARNDIVANFNYAYWVNLHILIESALPEFKLTAKGAERAQAIEKLIEILRRTYQQLTKEPLLDKTTEQVTTLEVPATKEINVEVENTAEAIAPTPDAKSLLEQLANQTGVDKAIIADAILNDRQSKFDSEQKKLRDLLR